MDTKIYKINDVVDSEFIRFPLALLANQKYRGMSLEAKVVYSLLLNRLTLSQRNGWLNDKKEVYLIYTREETAATLGITYKKAIAAFKELLSHNLIIEQRRGRGFPNIIFVVKTDLSETNAEEFGEQFNPSPGMDAAQNQDVSNGKIKTCQNGSSRSADTAGQDIPVQHIKTCQNSSLRTAGTEAQDMPKQQTSNIKYKNIDFSQIENSQSVCPMPVIGQVLTDRQVECDTQYLEDIYSKCEFEIWKDEYIERIFKSAIERMYYSEHLKIGDAVIPREKVLSYLKHIDSEVIVATYDALRNNRERVKNVTAYIISVLFNNICEKDSGILVNLPPEYQSYGGG